MGQKTRYIYLSIKIAVIFLLASTVEIPDIFYEDISIRNFLGSKTSYSAQAKKITVSFEMKTLFKKRMGFEWVDATKEEKLDFLKFYTKWKKKKEKIEIKRKQNEEKIERKRKQELIKKKKKLEKRKRDRLKRERKKAKEKARKRQMEKKKMQKMKKRLQKLRR